MYHYDQSSSSSCVAAACPLQVVVTLVFTPGVWQSVNLNLEYYSGTLVFMVDLEVSGRVLWNRLSVYPFTYSMNNYFIRPGDVSSATDRSLCNCTSW